MSKQFLKSEVLLHLEKKKKKKKEIVTGFWVYIGTEKVVPRKKNNSRGS